MKFERRKTVKRTLSGLAASVLVGILSLNAFAQNNTPLTRFDNGYLSGHPEVAQQLASDPGLVDNHQFMSNHPGLEEYFKNHPEVRAQLKTHPQAFMAREDQLNNWHGQYNPPEWRGNGSPYSPGFNSGNANSGWWANHGAAGRFDNAYLKSHPEVAQQLAANPALIDNPQYMKDHPDLQQYLQHHPWVRHDLRQHPRQFMGHEDQLNGWHPGNNYGHPLVNTDNYLDHNPQLNQQLAQNPRLVDNPQFMASHPGLREYMQTHPEARQQWRSHPYGFMHRENQYGKTH
jgi:hypothetical protein